MLGRYFKVLIVPFPIAFLHYRHPFAVFIFYTTPMEEVKKSAFPVKSAAVIMQESKILSMPITFLQDASSKPAGQTVTTPFDTAIGFENDAIAVISITAMVERRPGGVGCFQLLFHFSNGTARLRHKLFQRAQERITALLEHKNRRGKHTQ